MNRRRNIKWTLEQERHIVIGLVNVGTSAGIEAGQGVGKEILRD